jgi:glycosyltransferase involved in cell wall biosynthesis
MKILLASGTPYLPQVCGGLEVNTHELATELVRRGHEVSVLARLSYRDLYGLKAGVCATLRRQMYTDRELGYHVFRSREPSQAIARLRAADVAVIQNGHPLKMARALARRGIATIIYNHGLGFDSWVAVDSNAHPASMPIAGYLSNSHFTADRFRARYGVDSYVIPPIFRAERYRTARQAKFVTFINPVAVKGLHLALAIAQRCPDIPFCFVKGWPLSPLKLMRLRAQLMKLPNVTFLNNAEMKDVYSKTRVLLVPSQWPETWGRVASEAHFSGIPIVASDSGGLPESVGPGGVIIRSDAPVEHWVNAIDRLWNNDEYYRMKSAAALEYSKRSTLDINRQILAFEDFLVQRIGDSTQRRHMTRPVIQGCAFA